MANKMTIRGVVAIFLVVQFSASGYASAITNEISGISSRIYEDVESSSEDTTESIETSTPENLVTLTVKHSPAIYFSDKDSNMDRQFTSKYLRPLINWPKCGENEWFYPGDIDGDWM